MERSNDRRTADLAPASHAFYSYRYDLRRRERAERGRRRQHRRVARRGVKGGNGLIVPCFAAFRPFTRLCVYRPLQLSRLFGSEDAPTGEV